MAAYVDSLFKSRRTKTWKHSHSCRLYADTWLELHKFAARLGLKHNVYCHGETQIPHYLLNNAERSEAIRRGAIQLHGAFGADVLTRIRESLSHSSNGFFSDSARCRAC